MNFSKNIQNTSHASDIDITALVDVVFLLLIFFMLTTSFNENTRLSVNLPKASLQPQKLTGKPLEITINAKGNFYIGQEQLSLEQISKVISKQKAGTANLPLIIRADKDTKHGKVVSLMELLSKLEITNISIATTD